MEDNIYLNGVYLESNPTYDIEHSGWKAELIYRLATDGIPTPSRVIEVGCGAGGILAELGSKWEQAQCKGFDISSAAIELASKFEGSSISYVCGDLLETSEYSDLVVCADVFEHVDDYVGFLRDLRKHGSHFAFHIPLDLSAATILVPSVFAMLREKVGHIHYFNKETALETLKSCGYEVLASEVTAGCIEFPGRGLQAGLLLQLRKLLFRLSPDLAARVLGGFSLLVLAKTSAEG
jgi:SAM-dependent methyltransferase